MNFESDLNGAFKIANLTVAGLSDYLSYSADCKYQRAHPGRTTNGSQSFIIGLYIIAFGMVLGLLEFNVPPEAHTYGSFLFSFIGRGVFYTFIGASIKGESFFRVFAGIIIFLVGLVFIALEAVPSISPPSNMNTEGVSIGNEEDVV